MSEIHKNDSNKYSLLKAYAFYEQGNVETVKKELFSIIADKNTTTLLKAYCYYMLATTCFSNSKKIQKLYIFNALDACDIVSIPLIYPLCIQHLINFKCNEYTRYNLHKMISRLGTYYSSILDARSKKLQYFVHLIQEKYRVIWFPGLGPNELAIENRNRILNRFLISLDLQSLKLLDRYLGCIHTDEFFIISMLEDYSPKQMRQIYVESFQKDICNSLKQYFNLAQHCKKHEDKERCYAEIRNFLSEFTSDEISRYKELQKIQKKLDGIYDKNTK